MGEGHFTTACRDRIRGNGFKLKKSRSSLDIRKKFFPVRVVRHWERLLRKAGYIYSFPGKHSRPEWTEL